MGPANGMHKTRRAHCARVHAHVHERECGRTHVRVRIYDCASVRMIYHVCREETERERAHVGVCWGK